MDTLGKMVLSGSVWVWDPLGIFLYIPTSLLDQVLVCLLAPGFIAIAYSHQGPYFRQIKLDFTLCLGYSLLLQSGQPSKFKGEIKWVVPATSPPFRVLISIHFSLLFPEKVSQSNFASSSFVKKERTWEKRIQWSPITIFEFWLLLHRQVMTQRQML